jgi:hypothetical protein
MTVGSGYLERYETLHQKYGMRVRLKDLGPTRSGIVLDAPEKDAPAGSPIWQLTEEVEHSHPGDKEHITESLVERLSKVGLTKGTRMALL